MTTLAALCSALGATFATSSSVEPEHVTSLTPQWIAEQTRLPLRSGARLPDV